MFEKESEEWSKEIRLKSWFRENDDYYEGYCIGNKEGFQEGAQCGYNKALKEIWHYTSKGDLPKSEGSYYVAMDNGRGYKSGGILNWVKETDCEEDFHWEDDDYECFDEQVYAWKECPVLPSKECE